MLKITTTSSDGKPYVPPVIANGELTCQVDYSGSQRQGKWLGSSNVPQARIWYAGRRYNNRQASFVPQGHFETLLKVNGEDQISPDSWTQSLLLEDGTVESCAEFACGVSLEARTLVSMDSPVIACHRKLTNNSKNTQSLSFEFQYFMDAPERPGEFPSWIFGGSVRLGHSHGVVSYSVDGIGFNAGRVVVLTPSPMVVPFAYDNGVGLPFECKLLPGESVERTYYLAFVDNMDFKDLDGACGKMVSDLSSQTFETMLEDNRREWGDYWGQSTVSIPDEAILKSYMVSLYHLRCISTRWSIPTGLFDTHWHGRYFGFDEFYSVYALLTAGRIAEARKVAKFRHRTLDKAIFRACSDRQIKFNEVTMAQYPWETVEDGSEGAPAGFWMSHVFHMAHIALTCWQNYRYAPDGEFLKNVAYPVIRACAEFFSKTMLYETPDGRLIVGSCTDFERLGGGRRNAFATTCSIIATLRAAADSSEILNVDESFRECWRRQAKALHEALPNDGKRYIPYPECTDMNVGIIAGIFPYAAVSTDDPLGQAAFDAFYDARGEAGNMYHQGKGICSWYAGWACTNSARYGRTDIALSALHAATANTGAFHELFELCEPDINLYGRTWFSTGEAMFIQGVDEMLLSSDETSVTIGPAIPEVWKDVSFTLQGVGGLKVSVVVKDGCIQALSVENTSDAAVVRCVKFGSGLTYGGPCRLEIPPHGYISLK